MLHSSQGMALLGRCAWWIKSVLLDEGTTGAVGGALKLACKTAFSSMASHWAGLDVMSWPEGTPRHIPSASSSANTLGGRNGRAGFCGCWDPLASGLDWLTWANSSLMRMPPVALEVDSLLEASVVAAGSDSLALELRSSAISGGMVEFELAAVGGSAGGGADGTGVTEIAGTTGAGAAGTVAGVVGAVEAAGVTTTDDTVDLGSSGESARNWISP